MFDKNMTQEFRLKNIYMKRDYLIEEINRNELMSKRFKKVCTILIVLASAIIGYVSSFSLTSFIDIPIEITSSEIELSSNNMK